MQSYAMLHCHTEHSLKDSPLHIREFVSRAKEMGCVSLAITDHGTGTGLIEFKKCCEKNGIKPILGVELYVTTKWNNRSHMIVLARNKKGYEQMSKVLSIGWDHPQEPVKDNFIPVNTMEEIKLLAGGNCYITTACVSGILSSIYIYNDNNNKKRKKLEKELKKYVSPDNEYYTGNIRLIKEAEEQLKELEEEIKKRKEYLSQHSASRMKAREKALASYSAGKEYEAARNELDRDYQTVSLYKEELEDLSGQEKRLKDRIKILTKEVKKAEKEIAQYIKVMEEINAIPVMTDEEIEKEMEQAAKELKELFGEQFFIELQYHGMPEEKRSMQALARIAEKLDIEMIAANDSHVATREQVYARTLIKTTRFNKWEDTTEADKELYMKSDDELTEALLKILPEKTVTKAMKNIQIMADGCENFKFESHIPAFIDNNGKRLTEEESSLLLETKARKNIEKKYGGAWNEDHERRLVYELDTIKDLGYSGYTLIVADFLNYAKNYAITNNPENTGYGTGPGRGSGAGSIVNFLVDITNIDPIRYGLKFERYLNIDRVSMPDIDSDFSEETRYAAIEYVRLKYGEECVAGIRTISTQLPKGAVREGARIARIEREKTIMEEEKADNKKHFLAIGDVIAKAIPTLDDEGNPVSLKNYADTLKESFHDIDSINVIDKATAIEGVIKNLSVHAAGIIIGDGTPLNEIIPVLKPMKQPAIACDMVEAEEIGLLKMDFLGLRNLDVISECLRRIKRRTGITVDIEHVPFEAEVFKEIFCKGNTNCVFQFESGGMKSMLRQFCPESFEDIILLVAAYRPGPMEFINEIIEVKHGRKDPDYILSELEDILDTTYGKPIYQEQLMDIFHKCAGFSLGQADIIRRYMSKKKVEQFLSYKPQFIEGMVNHGAKEEDAEAYWESLEDFSKYAFNKSHAAAYALISYQTAYLKYHYPLEYMCSCLNHPAANVTMSFLIRECRNMGIEIIPPSINQSFVGAEIQNNKIIYGLGMVEGVKTASKAVVEERNQSGPYQTFADFLERTMPASDVIKAFIKAGVFDEIADGQRKGLEKSVNECCEILKKIKDIKKKIKETELMINSSASKEKKKYIEKRKGYEEALNLKKESLRAVYISSDHENQAERLRGEKEVLGAFLSAHPLDTYRQSYREEGITQIEDARSGMTAVFIGLIENVQIKKRKKDGKKLAIFTLEDISSDIDVICPVYVYENNMDLIADGEVVRVKADIMQDKDIYDDNGGQEENKRLIIKSVKKCLSKEKPVIASFKGKEDAKKLAAALKEYRVEDGHQVYVHDMASGKLTPTKMIVSNKVSELKEQGFIINFLPK